MQRSHYSEEWDPLAAINYRVARAVRAEEAAALSRQLAERPRSPRTVRRIISPSIQHLSCQC